MKIKFSNFLLVAVLQALLAVCRGLKMKLIISFSGRADGNCDRIASYISLTDDTIVYFRELNVHPCSCCEYKCIPVFEKWFQDSQYEGRVLGIERHLYGQKMKDCVLDVENIRKDIQAFLQS